MDPLDMRLKTHHFVAAGSRSDDRDAPRQSESRPL